MSLGPAVADAVCWRSRLQSCVAGIGTTSRRLRPFRTATGNLALPLDAALAARTCRKRTAIPCDRTRWCASDCAKRDQRPGLVLPDRVGGACPWAAITIYGRACHRSAWHRSGAAKYPSTVSYERWPRCAHPGQPHFGRRPQPVLPPPGRRVISTLPFPSLRGLARSPGRVAPLHRSAAPRLAFARTPGTPDRQ